MDVLGLVSLPDWLVYLVALVATLYIYYTWHFNFFKNLGIPGPSPVPVLGNFNQFFKLHWYEADRKLLAKYGKVFGLFEGREPTIVTTDTDILKQIGIKDFNTFTNRRDLYLRGFFKKGLFDAGGETWRRLRHILTPSFTTGKLKQMTNSVNKCADQLVANLQSTSHKNEALEAKDYAGNFTMDVIAATVFCLELNSQKDRNNSFVVLAKKFFDIPVFGIWVFVIFFMPFLLPILEWFEVCMFPKESETFFKSLSNQAVQSKKEGNNHRIDFLQLMINAEQDLESLDEEAKQDLKDSNISGITSKKGLTPDEITAQCVLFFLAGYETTATTISFLMYNLAVNPDIQEKLHEEITTVMQEYKEANYEAISKMSYLDMCIQETLRIFPPVARVDRKASQDIEIKGMKIPKDTVVIVPIRALMMDPEVWPEPEKFDPDRFTTENKSTRDPLYHMPFGIGPRICIGQRLAMMEVKLAMVKVLSKFKVMTCEKTQIPLKLKNMFFAVTEQGIWLKLDSR